MIQEAQDPLDSRLRGNDREKTGMTGSKVEMAGERLGTTRGKGSMWSLLEADTDRYRGDRFYSDLPII